MKILVIEPLVERGMRIRIADGDVWKAEKKLEHGQDIVVALHGLTRALLNTELIVVRARVGSFSASRTALVAGNVLSATRGIPLCVVEDEIETVQQLAQALKHAKKKFEYELPPNITLKK